MAPGHAAAGVGAGTAVAGSTSIQLGVVLDDFLLRHATVGHAGTLAVGGLGSWRLADSVGGRAFACRRDAGIRRGVLVRVVVLEDAWVAGRLALARSLDNIAGG